MTFERILLQDITGSAGRDKLIEVAKRIECGEVFVYPTETIYGIGGRCDRKDVYARIIAAKVRRPDNPMILISDKFERFASLALTVPPAARLLADKFWPGLLTLVLPGDGVPEGIAIRVSEHPFITALAKYSPWPLFSTSANVSGEPYDPDPDAIFTRLCDRVDFMIDAGTLQGSLPSTVARVTADNRVTVLREGCISIATIEAAVTVR